MKRQNDDAAAPGEQERKKVRLPQPVVIPLGAGATVKSARESGFNIVFGFNPCRPTTGLNLWD